MNRITTKDIIEVIDKEKVQLIDVRGDSEYFGFKDNGCSGHIRGSIQFSSKWLPYILKEKFKQFAIDKGIDFNKNLIFYSSKIAEIESVVEYFSLHVPENKLSFFTDIEELYNNFSDIFEIFPGYKYFVDCAWVNEILLGNRPDTYELDDYLIVESYSSARFLQNADSDYYFEEFVKQHIKGAILMDIDQLEGGPSLNIYPLEQVKSYLEGLGLSRDKTIILYSHELSGPYRAGFILEQYGFKDVRFLNSKYDTWVNDGYPIESGTPRKYPKSVIPDTEMYNDQYVISDGETIYSKQQDEKLKLVSVRRWSEHIGEVFGYESNNLLNREMKIGEPKNAIWGFCGGKKGEMTDYFDPDGSIRNPYEIARIWKTEGINHDDYIAFYCGTGWRACLPYYITKVLGWEKTVVYDGSWLNWQQNPDLPLADVKDVINREMPNSKNEYC